MINPHNTWEDEMAAITGTYRDELRTQLEEILDLAETLATLPDVFRSRHTAELAERVDELCEKLIIAALATMAASETVVAELDAA